MRDHVFFQHKDAASLVRTFGRREPDRLLRRVRRLGMWAFVSIPKNRRKVCVVHYWSRRDQDPRLIALMIGHELGHIADGGPKDSRIGAEAEEERAQEFGRAAQEAMNVLAALGLITDSAGNRFDPRGPSRSGRLRKVLARSRASASRRRQLTKGKRKK